jgi:hypothetical protein
MDGRSSTIVTLTGYAGVPAVAKWIRSPHGDFRLVLSFAYLNGRWIPFDVERHIAFRDRNGQLAGVEELVADPALIDAQTQGILLKGAPYSSLMSKATLLPFVVAHPLRAEMQQPWPRLRYELRRVTGLERD